MLALKLKECFNSFMQKTEAIKILGGSIADVAEAIGITPQAVSQWPDELPARIADRVQAAIARKALPDLTSETAKA